MDFGNLGTKYEVLAADREILRELADQQARAAALPIQQEKARLWTALNDRRCVRPMVWINEIPWNEMNINEELTLRCQSPWARQVETEFRRTLYQWRHMPADMIISPYMSCHLAIDSTGFGIAQEGQQFKAGSGWINTQHFQEQIHSMEDVLKIMDPVVRIDWQETQARYVAMRAALGSSIPVRKEGVVNYWYTPWDNLIRWYGVETALLDLIDKPDLVNAAVQRTAEAYLAELDQIIALGALSFNGDNHRVGSGGYGYASDLPGQPLDPSRILPHNNWGCSNAQVFSEVSPEMHWEFALRHDIPWLSRWGLNYYGCCEPLHLKLPILRRIPRLRKVSMNYRINLEQAVQAMGGDFVFSYKPNPAWLAEDTWRPDRARAELVRLLDCARGCHVEIIMKDISTLRFAPQRLWEWATMAMELVEQAAR